MRMMSQMIPHITYLNPIMNDRKHTRKQIEERSKRILLIVDYSYDDEILILMMLLREKRINFDRLFEN